MTGPSLSAILEQPGAEPAGAPAPGGPLLCVVVPTFNERDNVEIVVERLARVLRGIDWEVVFVDDDSPDGTAERVRRLGRTDRRVRCIRRVGRRGLSSASIEGMLSTSASFVAVMDGDLQHDEGLLPRMLERLAAGACDLVIASRYTGAGSSDGLSAGRRRLSRAGVRLARLFARITVDDPVSGFFMLRRDLADSLAPRLSGVGTKILIDILTSAPRSLSVVELPYRFRARHSGESKHGTAAGLDYVFLLAEKMSGRYVSHKLMLFGLVGASGVAVNIAMLRLLLGVFGGDFIRADAVATAAAMVSNFFLNNILTYRDSRLVGWRALRGLLIFMAVCGIGAVVNVAVARDLYAATGMWLFAGIAGAAVGALLNYALSSIFTSGRRL